MNQSKIIVCKSTIKCIHKCIWIETHTDVFTHIHRHVCVYKSKCMWNMWLESYNKGLGASPIYRDLRHSVCVASQSHYNIILTMKCNNMWYLADLPKSIDYCFEPRKRRVCCFPILIFGNIQPILILRKYSINFVFQRFTFWRPLGREWQQSRQIRDLEISTAPGGEQPI